MLPTLYYLAQSELWSTRMKTRVCDTPHPTKNRHRAHGRVWCTSSDALVLVLSVRRANEM